LIYKIEVWLKNNLPDVRGLSLAKDIYDLGITTVSNIRVVDIYRLDTDLKLDELDLICQNLLVDSVIQEMRCESTSENENKLDTNHNIVEVAYNAGVTDPVEETSMKAVLDLGVSGIRAIKTAKRYLIEGHLNEYQLETISNRLLVNPIIQHVVKSEPMAFPENPQYIFKLKHMDILGANKDELMKIGRQFGFTNNEFQTIGDYFRKQQRNPTDAELETLAQTWSEHCVHKTFKDRIKFGDITIDNLLKNTIMKVTEELNKPWCLSVFEDNAGVIDFDGRWALCFKVETHNHPSAVEPYGGASTGVGGVVRDALGTGLGAKPILNTDVFCFGPPDFPYDRLPRGILHPRRIFKGVHSGVADYGNRLGIPTANGAILFDERYVANPLVFCGTLGLLPKNMSKMGQQRPGDLVVLAGGKTGRDGIHGVTFASEQLTEKSSTTSYSSVQIGNPIVEKKLIDVILQARDRGLYSRITDCGGGGLSSAVGEMAAKTGAHIYLDRVPLKYSGLSYSEIWISESQERMVLAVPPKHIEKLLALFSSEDVEATVIGEFSNDRKLQLFYQDNLVCDLSMQFLHRGRPRIERKATWEQPQFSEPNFAQPQDLNETLLQVLGAWNICSKEWIIRQYDHEVQGTSVLKPLVGSNNDGPSDAAIIRPLLDSTMGVIISNGINHKYGEIDPYWMAASNIDEVLRQIVAVGGDLKRVALLDNFSWGNTNQPDTLGALVRAAQACYDMATTYGTPFISGKDSLNNEFEFEGETISIPHTLLISAIGIMEDVNQAISMDFKKADDLVYIIGNTWNELGGTEYFRMKGFTGNNVPKVNPQQSKELMYKLSSATKKGLVEACHDLSEGGFGTAVAEMAFAGGLGATVHLGRMPLGEPMARDDSILFSESNSRFLVEVAPENKDEFEKTMSTVNLAVIGQVSNSETLDIYGMNGRKIVSKSLSQLKEAWQKPLRW